MAVVAPDTSQPPIPAPAAPTKASSGDTTDDRGGDATTVSAGAAANPAQPVAAPLLLGTLDATSTPPNAASASAAFAAPTAIGDVTKGRSRSGTILTGEPDSSSAQDAAAADKASAQFETADKPASGATDNAAKLQAANSSNSSQQAQNQVSADPAVAVTQTDGLAPTYADHAAGRSSDPSIASSPGIASGSTNAAGGIAGGKIDGTGLPNFGFATTTTAANATGSATPGTTSAAAGVPIAGLAVAIAARAQSGSSQFDIRLDPPELGRIDIRLDVDRDGQVTTHMTADRADTLELLQSQQPQIQQALEQAGLKTADNGLNFTLRDQSFAGQNNGSGPQTNGGAQLVIPDADLTPVAATQIYTRAGLGGGVDIRV